MIRQFRVLGLAVVLTVLTTACQRGMSDLEEWVAETLRTPAGEIDPIPPIATVALASYDAYDLRDPFQQRVAASDEFEGAEDAIGVRPDPDRRREYLEGFPLDALTMVGTLEHEGEAYALIRDTEQVVHRVREGNYMGANHGRVVRVGPDRVDLVELFQDARGVWVERRARIVMAETG